MDAKIQICRAILQKDIYIEYVSVYVKDDKSPREVSWWCSIFEAGCLGLVQEWSSD